jgi:hypothetical protein
LRRLGDFLICSKAPALLEQAAKDIFLHLFGVGSDEQDTLPTAATAKIATQWVQISQRHPRIRVWIAHNGILPFLQRAGNNYVCGFGYWC